VRLATGFIQVGSISSYQKEKIESPIRKMVMRKNRKASRRGTRRNNRRNMYGGAYTLSPMELTDTSMMSASKMSGAQGLDFLGKHAAQHGGGGLMGAPVGDTGMLDSSLRAAARMGPLDASYQAVVGMKDQSGGKRRRSSRRANSRRANSRRANSRRANSRRANTRRTSRRSTRRNRRQNGGMAPLGFMETSAPGTLLSGSQASAANSTMNREWALAANPSSFAPKLTGF
jgi:hypothetical protein